MLIPCSQELVGSNPTPRAYLGALYQNNKREKAKNFNCKGYLSKTSLKIQQLSSRVDSNSLHKITKEVVYEKINSITKTCSKPYFSQILKKLASESLANANIICDYIIAEQNELNIKNSTKEGKIKTLVWLSNFFDNKIIFRQLSNQDILQYLNSGRKSMEDDKTQRWIGSYNNRQMILLKFFRWLYNTGEMDSESRKTPKCMHGIKQLRRLDKIRYKPSDMWYPKETTIFLKYCPSKRDKCYHAMAIDTSCRPNELLNLKISEILFKMTESGKQYAEVVIKGGKSEARTIPLIDSVPFIKSWIQSHPNGNNSDSWLFVSESNTTFGSKLTYDGLSYRYKYFYKTRYYPKLLNDETVSEDDKSVIRSLLNKPFNLYVLRHSSLTDKSTYLNENILRSIAGWTPSSKIPQVYIHYLGNEAVNSILEARGLMKRNFQSRDDLQTKLCTNCSEPNPTFQKFCTKCQMVMSYDSYRETLDQQGKKQEEILALKQSFNKEMIKLKEQITKDVKKEVYQYFKRRIAYG